jgi:repressor LexA
MTKNQAAMLQYIRRYIREHGYSPSYEEMKDGIGIKSKSGVSRIVIALAERGFINRLPNRARAIEVVRMP